MVKTWTAVLLLAAGAADLPASSKVAVGQPAPEFAVTTVDGRKLPVSALRGKKVLIFMWASW